MLGMSWQVTLAMALPLCEHSGFICRGDIESRIWDVLDSLTSGVPSERDRRNAAADLDDAVEAFTRASATGASLPVTVTEEKLCGYAGKEDDRGLKSIAQAVEQILKLREEQFTDDSAFDDTRNKVENLISVALDGVDTNIDQVDFLDGADTKTAARIVDAEKRLSRANDNLLAGKFDKAADDVQSAYDVIRDKGNVATCLQFQ